MAVRWIMVRVVAVTGGNINDGVVAPDCPAGFGPKADSTLVLVRRSGLREQPAPPMTGPLLPWLPSRCLTAPISTKILKGPPIRDRRGR